MLSQMMTRCTLSLKMWPQVVWSLTPLYWVGQKSSFGFFCTMLWETPKELFGLPNTIGSLVALPELEWLLDSASRVSPGSPQTHYIPGSHLLHCSLLSSVLHQPRHGTQHLLFAQNHSRKAFVCVAVSTKVWGPKCFLFLIVEKYHLGQGSPEKQEQ